MFAMEMCHFGAMSEPILEKSRAERGSIALRDMLRDLRAAVNAASVSLRRVPAELLTVLSLKV